MKIAAAAAAAAARLDNKSWSKFEHFFHFPINHAGLPPNDVVVDVVVAVVVVIAAFHWQFSLCSMSKVR